MESPHVCVVDSSPAVCETLAIILGDGYVVDCLSPEEFRRNPSRSRTCNALIIGEDLALADMSAAFPAGIPVLWLRTSNEPPPFVSGRWASLPRTFDPQEIRATLQGLLASDAPQRTTWNGRLSINYPVIPKDAALLARRAGRTSLPVLLCGEVGTGKARLARAIHGLGQIGRFVPLSASTCTYAALLQAAGLAPGNLTLFVSDLAETGADGHQVLRELLDCGGVQSDAGWHSVRLICATAKSFEELARLPGLSKDLFYRLSVLPITLPRLRDRVADIRALVKHLSTQLTRGLSLAPVSFTPRAMQRLERYLWFGNLAELETVLTRTIALAQSDTIDAIDAGDLLFGYGRLVAEHAAPGPPEATVPARPACSTAAVDLVINELAHEFKNPMVMIKTVSQHLERLLADGAGREEVTRLTGEAIARMDRALENLLQFTRFRAPIPESVALNTLLAPCLTDLTPQLAERRVLLNYHPPDVAPIFVDGAQIVYAFENLLRVIVRDLDEGATLAIRAVGAPIAVIFEFMSRHPSIAGKLAALLGHAPAGDEADAPLGLVFARALVERNGGHIDAHSAGERTTITVSLPSLEKSPLHNGKTANPHS